VQVVRRFLVTIAYQVGVRNPDRLPDQVLQDIYVINKLENQDLPGIQSWLNYNELDKESLPGPYVIPPKEHFYEMINAAMSQLVINTPSYRKT
jgi:hypothetical protein